MHTRILAALNSQFPFTSSSKMEADNINLPRGSINRPAQLRRTTSSLVNGFRSKKVQGQEEIELMIIKNRPVTTDSRQTSHSIDTNAEHDDRELISLDGVLDPENPFENVPLHKGTLSSPNGGKEGAEWI